MLLGSTEKAAYPACQAKSLIRSLAKCDDTRLTSLIQSETDAPKRDAMIAEAIKLHKDEIGHLPLHQQALAWGVKKNVTVVQMATNDNLLKWVVVK